MRSHTSQGSSRLTVESLFKRNRIQFYHNSQQRRKKAIEMESQKWIPNVSRVSSLEMGQSQIQLRPVSKLDKLSTMPYAPYQISPFKTVSRPLTTSQKPSPKSATHQLFIKGQTSNTNLFSLNSGDEY